MRPDAAEVQCHFSPSPWFQSSWSSLTGGLRPLLAGKFTFCPALTALGPLVGGVTLLMSVGAVRPSRSCRQDQGGRPLHRRSGRNVRAADIGTGGRFRVFLQALNYWCCLFHEQAEP